MREYVNAFSELWDANLSTLPNGVEDISQSLQREYILRRFNNHWMRIEEGEGSLVNQLIGVGLQTDSVTGKKDSVYEFYPSYYNDVLLHFRNYPITKQFGLNPDQVMNMPVDQWYRLRKIARTLKPENEQDSEIKMLQVLKKLLGQGKEGEE